MAKTKTKSEAVVRIPLPPPETMPDGLYVLTQDVKNPQADRRVRDDWRQRDVWECGKRMLLTRAHEGHATLTLYGSSRNLWTDTAPLCNEVVSAVLPHLEKTPETAWSIVRMRGDGCVGAEGVLQELLDAGTITSEVVAAAVDRVYDRIGGRLGHRSTDTQAQKARG